MGSAPLAEDGFQEARKLRRLHPTAVPRPLSGVLDRVLNGGRRDTSPSSQWKPAMDSNVVKVVGILVAHPGKAAELRTLLRSLIAPCRREPGNLKWEMWQDELDEDRFVLDELYANRAALEAHRNTTHFKDYFARFGGLADRTAYLLRPASLD